MKREHNLPLSNVKLELVLQNWLSRELSKRLLILPSNLQLIWAAVCYILFSSLWRCWPSISDLPNLCQWWTSLLVGAACPTFLVRWLPWRAPCHRDGRIGMQNLTDLPEISPTRADAWWVERWEVLRRNYADDASTDALIIFLRRVLVLNPALRPTAAEVL